MISFPVTRCIKIIILVSVDSSVALLSFMTSSAYSLLELFGISCFKTLMLFISLR